MTEQLLPFHYMLSSEGTGEAEWVSELSEMIIWELIWTELRLPKAYMLKP